MEPTTKIRIDGLERRAALRKQQAEEREARAPVLYSGGSFNHIESMTIADRYREEARQMRAEADRLRQQSR